MLIDNREILITGRLFKTARIDEEWFEDVENPQVLIDELKCSKPGADVFTFWQRLPERRPKYDYYREWDNVAALPIKSYEAWWQEQIKARTRNLIRKSEKKGVVVKETEFNDEFIRGITEIFNETPIRQGKPFWHYGKNFEVVKREFSKNLFREDLIGAYYNNELIGFIFLADAGKYAVPSQIISKIEHRDKSPNNALLAKAVEICAKKKISFLVYFNWDGGTLTEFKRRNGFEKIVLPRYYIPLTYKGRIALKLHLHHGAAGLLPERLLRCLKALRKGFYEKTKLIGVHPESQ